jgi:hypothetical protein
VIESLFRAYLEAGLPGERIQQFFTRHDDDALLAMAGPGSGIAAVASA